MPNIKASVIVSLREIMEQKGNDTEARLLEKLNADERRYYQTSLATEWVPMEIVSRIRETTAAVLYPQAADKLWKIGRDSALVEFKGIYRMLMRAASPQTVVARSARIWQTFHDSGDASVDAVKPTSAIFVVSNYPELALAFRESITGFIAGLLEMTGAKDIRVRHVSTNPKKWMWACAWK